jgi:hypothetical protein
MQQMTTYTISGPGEAVYALMPGGETDFTYLGDVPAVVTITFSANVNLGAGFVGGYYGFTGWSWDTFFGITGMGFDACESGRLGCNELTETNSPDGFHFGSGSPMHGVLGAESFSITSELAAQCHAVPGFGSCAGFSPSFAPSVDISIAAAATPLPAALPLFVGGLLLFLGGRLLAGLTCAGKSALSEI